MNQEELIELLKKDTNAKENFLNNNEAFCKKYGIELTEKGKNLISMMKTDEFSSDPLTVLQDNGVELSEEQLEMVSGGDGGLALLVCATVIWGLSYPESAPSSDPRKNGGFNPK